MSNFRRFSFSCLAPALLMIIAVTVSIFAQTYVPEPCNRVRINLGETPWKFLLSDPGIQAKEVSYGDAAWKTVGVPHCYNDSDTYVNASCGLGNNARPVWYRKHFTIDEKYRGRKVFMEFQGVNIAAAVYINGTFMKGNSSVPSPEATHVGGFLGFVVDISDNINFGALENVLAVRVSNTNYGANWYTDPGFGTRVIFSMGMGGIFRPVYLHITDKVYVPLNVYSVVEKWGTYVATISANGASASIRVQTNVENANTTPQTVVLTTKITDAANTVVLSAREQHDIPAGGHFVFDQTGDIAGPHLWYPAWSPYGGPYLYHVYSIVAIAGKTVDVFESPLGIRTIAFSGKDLYINGQQHILPGFGQRYEYPALGMAVPEEQQWRDIKLMTDAGGRFVRPGHCASSPATVAACDAFGVCIAQPSGDDEENFTNSVSGSGYACDSATSQSTKWKYKREFHRDMIIRDRNHPSVLMWETSNGSCTCLRQLIDITKQWEPVNPRMNSPRGGLAVLYPGESIIGSVNGCETWGNWTALPNWNAESWVVFSARHAWDYEKEFVRQYVDIWNKERRECDIFAFAQWYLAETMGECREYLEGKTCGQVRSLGCSAMDGNRIPKLIYRVWQNALWIPYSLRPGVTLQSHWNLSGTVDIDAWSNCPSVELFVNGISKGVRTPNDTTRRCTWSAVAWQAGTLRAEGRNASGAPVCSDQRVTSGAPHHIVLSAEPPLVKPDGKAFRIRANGSDAGFVLATIVDEQGNWCPLANNNIIFSVSGPGEYRGSYNIYVTSGQPQSYHAPLDRELQAEGGLMKVAVRTTFTTGNVAVTATSPGLGSGSTAFTIYSVDEPEAHVPGKRSLSGTKAFPGAEIRKTLWLPGSPAAFNRLSSGAAYDLAGRKLQGVPRLAPGGGPATPRIILIVGNEDESCRTKQADR